jgi:hypothetical protein
MKQAIPIFLVVKIMISIVCSFAYAKNYVCIDPGHCGPGASQFRPNGYGHGECGSQADMSLKRGQLCKLTNVKKVVEST